MKLEPKRIPVIRQPDGRWLIRCPDCSWGNAFGRLQNAVTRLSEHSLAKHNTRHSWPDLSTLIAEDRQ